MSNLANVINRPEMQGSIEAHSREEFDSVFKRVSDVIAPVWPLKDYVAVNPYFGMADRPFLSARAFLRSFSNCETLMPLEFYASQYRARKFDLADIQTSLTELGTANEDLRLSASQIADQLAAITGELIAEDQFGARESTERQICTIAEMVSQVSDGCWTETIRDEICKFCGAHYDDGQATWASPWKSLSLFQAWRSAALWDRNVEALGLKGMRRLVAELPHTPEACIVFLLQRMQVPPALWTSFLLCQAYSIPGWCAWAKYRDDWRGQAGDDLTGLLAIRLAYDTALGEAFATELDWHSFLTEAGAEGDRNNLEQAGEVQLRYILLRATEIAFRRQLLQSISSVERVNDEHERTAAQMVFCIDVRSERMRRKIESVSTAVETFGFAGFFGIPMEFTLFGESQPVAHLPVLLKPQFRLQEGPRSGSQIEESDLLRSRGSVRNWRRLWRGFQTSAVGCFSFVETAGLLFGLKLLQRGLGMKPAASEYRRDGLQGRAAADLGPTLRGLSQQGVTTSKQVDLVHSMLKNLGLTKDFARLIVFVGHVSQTDNNPLAAGLDCGACGGHTGEPNARFAALLLNQPYIRAALKEREVDIPDDTHFLGAVHNTTIDTIQYFDAAELPDSHRDEFEELKRMTDLAGRKTVEERLPTVGSKRAEDILRRAYDWSEVRPEWGLAGNAAFVVAPRSFTKNANLDARVFLHSYDYQQDDEGQVLETIMTAPMIVANWINMQYYASTVDNPHFGSGNKTLHNVVGRFGVLSGNAGDLKTGLPWQSLHNGKRYQHLPLRLQVVIAAPRAGIDRILAKHKIVYDLITNGWLHLVAIDEGRLYRCNEDAGWVELSS